MVLENLTGAFRGFGQGISPAINAGGKATFSSLGAADFKYSGSITIVPGVWTVIGSYKIKAQQKRHVGAGKAGVINSNIGTLYFQGRNNTATFIGGLIRIAIVDANGIVKGYPVNQVRTEKLNLSAGDKNIAFLIPEDSTDAVQDDYIQVQLNPDSDTVISVVDTTNNYLVVDTTLYSRA